MRIYHIPASNVALNGVKWLVAAMSESFTIRGVVGDFETEWSAGMTEGKKPAKSVSKKVSIEDALKYIRAALSKKRSLESIRIHLRKYGFTDDQIDKLFRMISDENKPEEAAEPEEAVEPEKPDDGSDGPP